MKNFNIYNMINAIREKNSLQNIILTRKNGKYEVLVEKPVIVLEKTEKGYSTKKVLKKSIL